MDTWRRGAFSFALGVLMLSGLQPAIAQPRGAEPCTSPLAFCRTGPDGGRWCGFKGETIRKCEDPRVPPPTVRPRTPSDLEAERRAQRERRCNECIASCADWKKQEAYGSPGRAIVVCRTTICKSLCKD